MSQDALLGFFIYGGKMSASTFFLDLDSVVLLGFQKLVSDLEIDSLIKGINAGDGFEPVVVERVGRTTYRIASVHDYSAGGVHGGHHRAIAHYIESKPLKCRLPHEEEPIVLHRIGNKYRVYDYFPIEQITIKDDKIASEELGRSPFNILKQKDPKFR